MLLLDIAKGLLPVRLARSLDLPIVLVAATALAVVLGHVYPIYFGFRGGKGVATGFGAFLGLFPLAAGVGLAGLRRRGRADALCFRRLGARDGRRPTARMAVRAGRLDGFVAAAAFALAVACAALVLAEALPEPAAPGDRPGAHGSVERGGNDADRRPGSRLVRHGAGDPRGALGTRGAPLGRAVPRPPCVFGASARMGSICPGSPFPEGLEVVEELGALANADPLVVAMPSHGYREVLGRYLAARGSTAPLTVVSATKGIESETPRPHEPRLRGRGRPRWASLAASPCCPDPTFAAEIARAAPSAAVIACADEEVAAVLRHALASPTLRLYSSADVVGVELAGTAKNVIAIAAGVVSGLGLGHNTLAALITRGLHEMTRLVVACGGDGRDSAWSRRPRRPGAHLHRRPVAQPANRSRARPGQVDGGDLSRARPKSPKGSATRE